jgi:hypothetical protein
MGCIHLYLFFIDRFTLGNFFIPLFKRLNNLDLFHVVIKILYCFNENHLYYKGKQKLKNTGGIL